MPVSSTIVLPKLCDDDRLAMLTERRGAGSPTFFCKQGGEDLLASRSINTKLRELSVKRLSLEGQASSCGPQKLGKGPIDDDARTDIGEDMPTWTTVDTSSWDSSCLDGPAGRPWNTAGDAEVEPLQRFLAKRAKAMGHVGDKVRIIVPAAPPTPRQGGRLNPRTAAIERASSLRRQVGVEFKECFVGDKVVVPVMPATPRQGGRADPRIAAIGRASSLRRHVGTELGVAGVSAPAAAADRLTGGLSHRAQRPILRPAVEMDFSQVPILPPLTSPRRLRGDNLDDAEKVGAP